MKHILEQLFHHQPLNEKQAEEVILKMAEGKYNQSQLASFITVYLMRSITPNELKAFGDTMMKLAIKPALDNTNAIDLCGTGGDSKNTFNISTLASFIVAGAGIKVIKHGNYGVSSVSGSSHVLEQNGYHFTTDNSILNEELEKANITFLHAPLFHPAMKNIAPVRKELGVKTFFNMLGPFVNPANPAYRLTGVFSLELARIYNELYSLQNKNYHVVHSFDGHDEISLTSGFRTYSNEGQKDFDPQINFGGSIHPEKLLGGATVEKSAELFAEILQGNGTKEQNKVGIINAAFAIQCAKNNSLEEAVSLAEESLISGKAFNSFKILIKK